MFMVIFFVYCFMVLIAIHIDVLYLSVLGVLRFTGGCI